VREHIQRLAPTRPAAVETHDPALTGARGRSNRNLPSPLTLLTQACPSPRRCTSLVCRSLKRKQRRAPLAHLEVRPVLRCDPPPHRLFFIQAAGFHSTARSGQSEPLWNAPSFDLQGQSQFKSPPAQIRPRSRLARVRETGARDFARRRFRFPENQVCVVNALHVAPPLGAHAQRAGVPERGGAGRAPARRRKVCAVAPRSLSLRRGA
jgi:hypothetical protein